MKLPDILAGDSAVPYEAWATMPSGAVKRLELNACTQPEALSIAFALAPGAVAMSVRQADRAPPRDALAQLARHAAACEVPA